MTSKQAKKGVPSDRPEDQPKAQTDAGKSQGWAATAKNVGNTAYNVGSTAYTWGGRAYKAYNWGSDAYAKYGKQPLGTSIDRATASGPIPLIMCSKKLNVFKIIQEHLAPDFEVVHAITSTSAGLRELPVLLDGGSVKEPASQLGSGRYFLGPPGAIISVGITDVEFTKLRDACKGTSDIPWLKPKIGTTAPDASVSAEERWKRVADKIKACLDTLGKEEKTKGDTVAYY